MLLGGIRSTAYRAGFSQGVYVGETRAEQVAPLNPDGPAAEAAPNPAYGPRGYGPEYRGHYHGGFGFFGGLFRLFFAIALIGFIMKMFKHRAWHHRRAGWGHYGPGSHWKHGRKFGGKHGCDHDGRSEKERAADEAAENGGDGPYVSM